MNRFKLFKVTLLLMALSIVGLLGFYHVSVAKINIKDRRFLYDSKVHRLTSKKATIISGVPVLKTVQSTTTISTTLGTKTTFPPKLLKTKTTKKIISDDFYDFLYGKDFEKAIDRASKAPKKKILFWHPPGDLSMSPSQDLPRECGGCEVRNDLEMIDDNSTEAIVIHYGYQPPPKRNPDHYWIWRCGEAPPYMSRKTRVDDADKVGFNMTFTYRRKSDFLASYGNSFIPTKKIHEDPLKNKNKLALIAVSNCDLTSGAKVRLEYIKELIRRGLQITAIGRCFSNNTSQIERSQHAELTRFTSTHKFYFAMENSFHCKDYVTEKFFRALQAGVVPVVWGATKETYERHIPSSGFIFIEDFSSMQSLIDYLNFLDKNNTAYLEYFRWRGQTQNHPEYRIKSGPCQICRFLHGINVDDAYKVPPENIQKNDAFIVDKPERKVITSLNKWWKEGENQDCMKAQLKLNENGRIIVVDK